MRITIIRRTLTDGSHVHDVQLADVAGQCIEVPADDEYSATCIAGRIKEAIEINSSERVLIDRAEEV